MDAEKQLDKIRHPFTTKALNKVDIEGTHLNITEVVYEKPSDNTARWQKADTFSSKLGPRQGAHSSHVYSTQRWNFWPKRSDKKEK